MASVVSPQPVTHLPRHHSSRNMHWPQTFQQSTRASGDLRTGTGEVRSGRVGQVVQMLRGDGVLLRVGAPHGETPGRGAAHQEPTQPPSGAPGPTAHTENHLKS